MNRRVIVITLLAALTLGVWYWRPRVKIAPYQDDLSLVRAPHLTIDGQEMSTSVIELHLGQPGRQCVPISLDWEDVEPPMLGQCVVSFYFSEGDRYPTGLTEEVYAAGGGSEDPVLWTTTQDGKQVNMAPKIPRGTKRRHWFGCMFDQNLEKFRPLKTFYLNVILFPLKSNGESKPGVRIAPQ